MSRRGAGSARKRTEFEFIEAPALARPVLTVAKELLQKGLSSAEVCSLFTHAASTLAANPDGLGRQEWLDLCAQFASDELEGSVVAGPALTSPGGQA